MDQRGRRLLFLLLFAVALFQTGAHASQAFVNYPAWKYIGIDTFPAYHRVMAPRAGLWILLPRLLELILAAAVLRYRPTPLKRGALVLAIALALVAVISTIVIQRPIHVQLESLGNTPELLARLQATNWLRLVPEWIRAGLYLWMASLLVSVTPEGANERRP
ncbi:MAG TPA: hypothetical protein VMT00_03980 [Thermoanaerobaculia bacterium]|nr:hypothetical protein [Thermoanaerobaculia bacterium]